MSNKRKALAGSSLAAAVAVILAGVYADEGGYVNHKNDRGGETNYGVTIGTARAAGYLGPMKNFPKHCTGDVAVCADKIYTDGYMRDPGFMPIIALDPAIGEELVNTAVNTGPVRPKRWFQSAINVTCGTKLVVDGKIGKGTLGAFETCQDKIGPVKFCRTMLDRLDGTQLAFYQGLVRANPSQRVFLKGWTTHRIGNVDRKKCEVTYG